MEMDSIQIRFAVSLVTSFLIAARAFKRKSVDLSGVLTGIPVMVIHMLAGYRFAALLLVFFFTASKLTRVGEERKRNIDAEFKEGGQRNWVQVLANSAIASILAIIFAAINGGQDMCLDTKRSSLTTGLVGGIIGHYACCNGDTWSSELGMLSNSQPRLITTFKTVRKGTNGGVTIDGLLAAAAAGCVIGLAFVLVGLLTTECAGDVAWRQFLIIPIASAAGFCGSMMDSLLGATLQFSGYCTLRKKVVGKQGPTVIKISGMNILDNNGVNAVSVLSTTLVTSITCLYVF
ncbi:protein PGR isoform X1 [Elaeis guineensis]|uniref:Protein PGR isoform X1 n=1 Tax=Elaeis guineensis var. tenera TaxID=51953 RepID=A0A6I9REM7_ELAGV|nr:protein PGR isoform X1 [Elaeis guineensis]